MSLTELFQSNIADYQALAAAKRNLQDITTRIWQHQNRINELESKQHQGAALNVFESGELRTLRQSIVNLNGILASTRLPQRIREAEALLGQHETTASSVSLGA